MGESESVSESENDRVNDLKTSCFGFAKTWEARILMYGNCMQLHAILWLQGR